MKNRTITNPINGDKVTFIKTCEETNGEYLSAELEVFPNAQGTSGAPPHYHASYTEYFHVLEGELTLTIGKKNIVVTKGQSATIPMKTIHTFSNKTSQTVKAILETRPGLQGFEDSLYIMYGLAGDEKTTKSGMPKSLAHLALVSSMSDTRFGGILSFLNPLMRLIAKKARNKGIEQELVSTYCK